ncbi:hypothetical protein SRB5_00410 [Streptomyces sp. RB5]|uniref:Immunity protein 21 of polymorphic toxin system n=1 Tax=Streptomyces smaragdinus TaxID=2585196 RepID=A0A7K0C944_9ACTN|nr:hypothetical protein [Streptomyces smaragdinus]MQY09938.1 hypothetical protein [Streptomyces smaragdinus]
MARVLERAELEVLVVDHLFAVVDEEGTTGPRPPFPHETGGWVSAAGSTLFVEIEDPLVATAVLCLEAWDGEPPGDDASWTARETVRLDLPSGVIGVEEMEAGGESDVLRVPSRGVHRARVALREDPEGPPNVLVRLWPAQPAA